MPATFPLFGVFGAPGWMELLIVGLIVLLLFGSRLPRVMRDMGRGITEFKRGIKGDEDAEERPERLSRQDEAGTPSERAAQPSASAAQGKEN